MNIDDFSTMQKVTVGSGLILDDDKVQHMIWRKRMELLRVDVELIFFEDLMLALDHLKHSFPDIVISDIYLENIDGWQFQKMVHDLGFKGEFYIASASVLHRDRLRADDNASISGYLEKPIQESDLIDILGL